MFGAIKYQLASLTQFSGRDARSTFGYYLICVAILRFVAGIAIGLPMSMRLTSAALEAAKNQVSEATLQVQTTAIIAETLPMMVWLGIALGGLTMLLLAASVVRRLHDRGLSGWWVLVPSLFYGASLALQPGQTRRVLDLLAQTRGTDMSAAAAVNQGVGSSQNLLAALAVLIVIAIAFIRSYDGPNRFGEKSVRF